MILHTKIETMPREDLEALQLKRLQTTVERCYYTVGFYRDAMDELGVMPRHIQSLADTRLLPFTKKEHLRDSYPFGMFAVPMDQVVRVHASSGTTGKPTVVGYTDRGTGPSSMANRPHGVAWRWCSNSKFGRVGETQCLCGPQKGINEPVSGPTGSLDLVFWDQSSRLSRRQTQNRNC